MSTVWLVAGVVLLVLVGLYLRGLAGRLDRLHLRVEAASEALDAQLVRRSAATIELASSGLLDPASSVLLAEAAHGAQSSGPAGREAAESTLSQALRATLGGPHVRPLLEESEAGRALLGDVSAACGRVVLARRFHNDAVAATRRLRRQRVVRYGRLAGSAALPRTFEIDDEPPASLVEDG